MAAAQTTHDLQGTWSLVVTVGGGTFPHTMSITSMNLSTGAFLGEGATDDENYTWSLDGTATGDDVQMTAHYNEIPYTATFTGSIGADTATMSGSFGDSSGQSGSWLAQRTRGRPRPPAPGGQPPPPTTGKNFNADVVSGEVTFKCPGGPEQPLEDAEHLRVGCKIDTREGKVRITSAAGGGKTQSGVFYGGVFKVLQKKEKRPVTELRLAGALEGCMHGRASGERVASAARKRGRRLWGNAKGRFRTRARRSVTTVPGTKWLVEDRCDGSTLTRVARGFVRVRDFKRHRTVTVRAGHSYVARP
jgi:hypothetical protein